MPNYLGKYSGMSTKERFDARSSDRLRREFTQSPSYYEVDVIKNDNSILNDFPIQIFNDNQLKQDSYKSFLTHPDYDLEYGNLIELDSTTYIVKEINNHNTINQHGELAICNNTLKWLDSNDNVIETPVYVDFNKPKIDDGNENIIIQEQTLRVYMQNNPETESIFTNQRFLLGRNAYTVSFIESAIYNGLLIITLDSTETSKYDDFDNMIAHNEYDLDDGTNIDSDDELSTYEFSKTSVSVHKGLAEAVSVYEYVDGVEQSTTFTFRIDNVDSSYYNLSQVDGNTVEIEGVDFPENGELVAIDDNTLEEHSIPIEFKGLW